ncbi:MAG: DUF861 domain-containing protein [Acidobacteria bacterium]|nr:DUF861 domain-containing protein [Acidobacteriota bacterium]
MTNHTHLVDALSVELAPSAPPSRIVSGNPTCGEKIVVDREGLEIGIWEVTPGVFDSVKDGIGEVVQFMSGAGRIEHSDGTVSPIAPGVVVEFLPGWTGRWVVEQTTRKIYTIYSA